MLNRTGLFFVAMSVRKSWTPMIAVAVVMLFAACSGASEPTPVATPAPTAGQPEGKTPSAPSEQVAEEKVPSAPWAPPVFSVATIDGEDIRLEELLGTSPVYVLFVPSVDDELDRAQVGEIQARYARFEALGANVVVIASDLPTEVVRLRDELKLEFPLIADPLNVIAADWQVFDLFGDGKGGPASFVFDAHGTLIARLIAIELDDRPSVDEVLQVIEESLSTGAA